MEFEKNTWNLKKLKKILENCKNDEEKNQKIRRFFCSSRINEILFTRCYKMMRLYWRENSNYHNVNVCGFGRLKKVHILYTYLYYSIAKFHAMCSPCRALFSWKRSAVYSGSFENVNVYSSVISVGSVHRS